MEDYLKTIYTLGHDPPTGPVNTGTLAGALGVADPSVTRMLKKLARLGLVDHTLRRGATLTPAGEQIALKVLRRHRLLKCYLSAVLGYGWDALHDEADRLEHVVSDELEARLDAALGYPLTDPHGDPIPSREGVMPSPICRPLTTLEAGEAGIVGRVGHADPARLRYLAGLGLFPGVAVAVLEALPFNGPLRVRVAAADQRSEHLLGREVAAGILVRDAEARGKGGEQDQG